AGRGNIVKDECSLVKFRKKLRAKVAIYGIRPGKDRQCDDNDNPLMIECTAEQRFISIDDETEKPSRRFLLNRNTTLIIRFQRMRGRFRLAGFFIFAFDKPLSQYRRK